MKRSVFATLLAAAILLGVAGSGDAMTGRGFSNGRPGGQFDGFHRFDGFNRFDHRFDHRRVFVHNRFFFVSPFFFDPFFVAAVPFPSSYGPPVSWWYYCQSARAYYPTVPSCPEPWVPVPAQ